MEDNNGMTKITSNLETQHPVRGKKKTNVFKDTIKIIY